jgi:hypothetical protein
VFLAGLLANTDYLTLLAMLGCGGGSESQPPLPAVTDVYTAGYELNDAGAQIAKYWKNGQARILGAGVNGSIANSIAVSGNDVYVAGLENNGTEDVAKYWKNGVPVELTDGTNRSYANSIFCLWRRRVCGRRRASLAHCGQVLEKRSASDFAGSR